MLRLASGPSSGPFVFFHVLKCIFSDALWVYLTFFCVKRNQKEKQENTTGLPTHLLLTAILGFNFEA